MATVWPLGDTATSRAANGSGAEKYVVCSVTFRSAPPENERDQQQGESAGDQPRQQFAAVVLFLRRTGEPQSRSEQSTSTAARCHARSDSGRLDSSRGKHVTKCSNAGGVSGWTAEIGSGSFSRIALATLIWLLPSNGLAPGHHLIKNGSQREQVRSGVGLLTLNLLRRHVLDRPDHRTRSRERRNRTGLGSSSGPPTKEARSMLQPSHRPRTSPAQSPSASRRLFVSMMFPGFRSRCTIPWRCATAQRFGDGDPNL